MRGVSCDSYYKGLPPGVDAGSHNWYHPSALDLDLLASDLRDLRDGRDVQVPKYCFSTHRRLAEAPLVSTSPYPSGGPPPVDAGGLDPWLRARIDLVLDGGRTPGGLPSTVVEFGAGAPRLLRAGAVPWEAVAGALRSPLPSRGG